MPITTFSVQLAGSIPVADYLSFPYDLFIVETGETSASSGPTISSADLTALQDDGRTVIGYINALVLDDNRAYYALEGLTSPDTGPFTEVVPSWLDVDAGGIPLAANAFGAYADITDTNWIDIVADQAEEIINAGYDGVFIDDVGTYFDFDAQRGDVTLTQAADAMMALVNAVVDRIGTEAYIAINRGADIFDHGTPGTQTAIDFRDNVDALLMENQIFTGAWGRAQGDFAADTAWLAADFGFLAGREGGPDSLDSADYSQMAVDQGVIPLMPDSSSYNFVAPAPLPASFAPATINGTAGPDLIIGTENDDLIFAFGGNDTVLGFGGDDTIYGMGGDDTLLGGSGNDVLRGRAGDDLLNGGNGRDLLQGQDGNDLLIGGNGPDRLFGGADDDRLAGGARPDRIDPGTGADQSWAGNLPLAAVLPGEEDWI